MSFKVQPIDVDDKGDKWELVFSDEPSYIHALKMAPEVREPELDVGIWLVVAFPVWSVPVRYSVVAAVTCAKDHNGMFQLGVRPFHSHEEIYKWWPSSEAPSDGQVLMTVRDEPQRLEIHISTDPSWYIRIRYIYYRARGEAFPAVLKEVPKKETRLVHLGGQLPMP